MLDETYPTAAEIPTGFAHLYTEKDGAFHLRKPSEIKTPEDTARLQGALTKERTDHATVKADLKRITGERTPDEILADLDKIEEYKLAADGNMDDAKIEQLVESRVKTRLAPVERNLAKATEELETDRVKLADYAQKDDRRLIRDFAREAATKLKVDPLSLDDALDFSERVLHVIDDNGTRRVVTKDNAGVTPGVDADVMLGEMQGKRRWWPEAVGAGSSGGNGGGHGSNPWSAKDWNLTNQGKVWKEQGEAKAGQMASAAGTTIGGPRPEAK